MKKTFGVTLALLISSLVPAAAADLPVRYTKAPAAIPFTWTGFYLGANGGCAWNRTNVNSPIIDGDPAPDSFFRFDTERQGGCFGGLQGGYNYQFSGNWVAGFEVDGQFGQISSRGQLLEVEGVEAEVLANYDQTMRHFGTARGRLGYASQMPVVGNTLLYVTGGFAWARNRLNVIAFEPPGGGTVAFSDTKTLTGYTVGAGIEIAIDRRWSWKAEYQYLDFGNNTYNAFVADNGLPFSAVSTTTKLHTARVGLNYSLR